MRLRVIASVTYGDRGPKGPNSPDGSGLVQVKRGDTVLWLKRCGSLMETLRVEVMVRQILKRRDLGNEPATKPLGLRLV